MMAKHPQGLLYSVVLSIVTTLVIKETRQESLNLICENKGFPEKRNAQYLKVKGILGEVRSLLEKEGITCGKA